MKNYEFFLKRLEKEKRLRLVEPSEEMKSAYLETSKKDFMAAKILLAQNLPEKSIPHIYYGIYNLVLALLFGIGVKCENHTASIFLLKELFEVDNSFVELAKKKRVDVQYYVDFNLTKKDVADFINQAEDYRGILSDFISKLTNEKIILYRNKFINLLRLKK